MKINTSSIFFDAIVTTGTKGDLVPDDAKQVTIGTLLPQNTTCSLSRPFHIIQYTKISQNVSSHTFQYPNDYMCF